MEKEDDSKNKNKGGIVLLLLLIVFGVYYCSKDDDNPPKVNWNNYDKELKNRIDSLVKIKDCNQLQTEFNNSADNSDRNYKRSGESNSKLMNYIDYQMKLCGCYK